MRPWFIASFDIGHVMVNWSLSKQRICCSVTCDHIKQAQGCLTANNMVKPLNICMPSVPPQNLVLRGLETRRYSQRILVGVYGLTLVTLSNENLSFSIPRFRPEPKIDTAFQTSKTPITALTYELQLTRNGLEKISSFYTSENTLFQTNQPCSD